MKLLLIAIAGLTLTLGGTAVFIYGAFLAHPALGWMTVGAWSVCFGVNLSRLTK